MAELVPAFPARKIQNSLQPVISKIPATRFSLWQNGALSDHRTNLTEQESDMKGNVVAV